VSRASYADLRFGLLNDMLVKVDRMSMAHSLEVRSPFLDHRLVEFVLSLPPRLKLRRGETKVILRRTVERRLPPATLRKPKQGFNVPLRDWFRGVLSGIAADCLLGSGGLPSHLFDRRGIELLLREHRGGHLDHSATIWLLLSYATWWQHLIAAPRGAAAARVPRLERAQR
jgi:asparagine synthase (glutamine-hydrolysing)